MPKTGVTKSIPVQVRIPSSLFDAFRAAAEGAGMEMSTMIRNMALVATGEVLRNNPALVGTFKSVDLDEVDNARARLNLPQDDLSDVQLED